MKKAIILTTILLLFPMFMKSQTYGSLWKQVKEANQNDLPQTEQELLSQIIQKAQQEQAYGQLLKAELQRAKSLCDVSPDSLAPVVERLKEREALASGNTPLQAIYNCVLGHIYMENRWLDEDRHEDIGREYYNKALELASSDNRRGIICLNICNGLTKSKQYTGALTYAEKAIEYNPELTGKAYLKMANINTLLGQYAEAISYCEKASVADITVSGSADRLKANIQKVQANQAENAKARKAYDDFMARKKAEEAFWGGGAKK